MFRLKAGIAIELSQWVKAANCFSCGISKPERVGARRMVMKVDRLVEPSGQGNISHPVGTSAGIPFLNDMPQ